MRVAGGSVRLAYGNFYLQKPMADAFAGSTRHICFVILTMT
jgi:hypothetical protein